LFPPGTAERKFAGGVGGLNVLQDGIAVEIATEFCPHCVNGATFGSGNCVCSCRLDKTQFSAETQCAGGVTSRQGGCTGAKSFRAASKAVSEREKERESKSAMLLVLPGAYKGTTWLFLARQSSAMRLRRNARGLDVETEPACTQACVGCGDGVGLHPGLRWCVIGSYHS
jgi:hypothetical protein